MGIHQLWEVVSPYTRNSTLAQFGSEFLEANGRWPVVAIDILSFYFEIESGAQASGYDIFHHNLIRRIRGFLKCGIIPIAVFDGPVKRHKLRHKRQIRLHTTHTTQFMKGILRAMGITVVDARGEGEAECTRIQQKGWADYVFSADSDCLVFGALKIMHFERPTKDIKTSSPVYSRPIRIVDIPQDAFSQWQFILVATLQGNDFSTGTKNIGHVDAIACSQSKDVVDKFVEWYQRADDNGQEFSDFLIDDLRNDYTGTKTKTWKTKKLKLELDRELVKAFASPVTSSTTLSPAHRSALIWHNPKSGSLIKLWNSPSPGAKKLAAAKEAENSIQGKEIEVIATELWCLHKIMLGDFKREYAEPLRKLSANTNFETIRLVCDELWGVCNTVKDGMEIKLPVHLTRNFARKEKEAPKTKPQRLTKADIIAQSNRKISFAKASRSEGVVKDPFKIVEKMENESVVSSPKISPEPFTPPRQVCGGIIDLTASSPIEVSIGPPICRLTTSPSEPPPDLSTDVDSPQKSIPTSVDLADSPPPPAAPVLMTKKPMGTRAKQQSTGRTPSVTAYFKKREATGDQSGSKRAKC